MSSKVEIAASVGHARQIASTSACSEEPQLVYVAAAGRSGPYAIARYNVWVPRDRLGYVVDEFWMPRHGYATTVQRYTFETLDELQEFMDMKDVYLWHGRGAGDVAPAECGWNTADWCYYKNEVGPKTLTGETEAASVSLGTRS